MEVLALILAGGRGSRLDILSEDRVKPSVPFAGKYRIIDFTLSNCSNSGIYNIAILTQYLPFSLNDHIGSGKPWDLDRRDSKVTLLQPHSEWYNGTADAVRKNSHYIEQSHAKYVLILSGDHLQNGLPRCSGNTLKPMPISRLPARSSTQGCLPLWNARCG